MAPREDDRLQHPQETRPSRIVSRQGTVGPANARSRFGVPSVGPSDGNASRYRPDLSGKPGVVRCRCRARRIAHGSRWHSPRRLGDPRDKVPADCGVFTSAVSRLRTSTTTPLHALVANDRSVSRSAIGEDQGSRPKRRRKRRRRVRRSRLRTGVRENSGFGLWSCSGQGRLSYDSRPRAMTMRCTSFVPVDLGDLVVAHHPLDRKSCV